MFLVYNFRRFMSILFTSGLFSSLLDRAIGCGRPYAHYES